MNSVVIVGTLLGAAAVLALIARPRIRNPRAPGGYSATIAHMPFARLAVEGSVTELVHDSVPLPAYEAGYEEWRALRVGCLRCRCAKGSSSWSERSTETSLSCRRAR
jgi:hypothetical protein